MDEDMDVLVASIMADALNELTAANLQSYTDATEQWLADAGLTPTEALEEMMNSE